MMPRDDETLVRDVRAGDESAFAEIYVRYSPSLVRHARRVLAQRGPDAEDVVQEAFMRAHRCLLADDREIVLRPWLHRIVHNGALDARRRPTEIPVAHGDGPDECVDQRDPYAVLAARDELRDALGLIAALPAGSRMVLMAHAVHGESHETVARELGLTVAASKTRLSRARSQLATAVA